MMGNVDSALETGRLREQSKRPLQDKALDNAAPVASAQLETINVGHNMMSGEVLHLHHALWNINQIKGQSLEMTNHNFSQVLTWNMRSSSHDLGTINVITCSKLNLFIGSLFQNGNY